MVKFIEWLKVRESTAFKRQRHDSARGLKPPMADYNSYSTPKPWDGEQLKKNFKKTHKKKKKEDE
jgi:hypothetical protein